MTDHPATRSETRRRSAIIIIASNRAAAGVYPDRSGPVIAQWLVARNWSVSGPRVVPDGPRVTRALIEAISEDPDLVITSGGTGVSPFDTTPESTAPLLDREIPGFMEELRRRGAAHTPTAWLTRGLAGVAGRSLVFNLPGSPGGVRDGLELLNEVLEPALERLAGTHVRADQAPSRTVPTDHDWICRHRTDHEH